MKRSLAKEIMSMSDDKLVEEVNRSFVSVKYHIIVVFFRNVKNFNFKKQLKEDFKNDIASVIEEKLHSFFDFIRDCNKLKF